MALLAGTTLLLVATAGPSYAGADTDPVDTGGGLGWNALIPAGVIGLAGIGALLATRVQRPEEPDRGPDVDPVDDA